MTNRQLRDICTIAALLFAYGSGLCTGVLIGLRWDGDGDAPTAREQEIERYEKMGR